MTLDFSRHGKPIDNAYIESFNSSIRDECLNINWFPSLEDARDKVEEWRQVEVRRVTAGDARKIKDGLIWVHGKEREEFTPYPP